MELGRIILVTDEQAAVARGRDPVDLLSAALAGLPRAGALVQVRAKELPARELVGLTRRVIDVARERRCPVLVNDRLDVALAAGADGVHLPEAGLPIAVAHGEGFADFSQRGDAAKVHRAMRFVDNTGAPTESYPFNPNGSPGGLTSVTTADGRFTVLMPHPERVFRNVLMSWTSGDRSQLSPWMRMFRNARKWVG